MEFSTIWLFVIAAAYLIYLGCKTLFSTSDRTTSEIPKAFHKKSRVLIIQYNPEWIATTPCSNVRRFVSHTERPRCFAGPALAPQSGRVSSL
ncbi:hypothetical protein [Aneurinibacillus aneurinilyticus]|uniref:hypothetical protein n=1 Tax=Aneurinibacillus aneurinilyticus TaxID=1391 RepID=UPI0023F512B6|nr:hypothetical protein [Aneurinibacillus aneurinilyticus]MCI1696884.1 hypothetical protein [Aneurinibacillus aneurinilyticus]